MADSNSETTVIGSDTHIKGEMTFQKTVRLVGTFEGSLSGDGELAVAKGGACKATIRVGTVLVDGIVEGNLMARDKVQLNASGVVKGDIVAGKMVMAEGASFFGQCAVGAEAVKAADKTPGRVAPPTVAPAAPPAPAGKEPVRIR